MIISPPAGMTTYEHDAWHEIQTWKDHASRPGKQLVPDAVKQAGHTVAEKSTDLWEQVPGNAKIAAAVSEAVEGGFQLFTDAIAEAVTEQLLLKKYEPHFGHRPSYEELRALDLSLPDSVVPNLRRSRPLVSAATGGAAGFVAGGATATGAATGGAAVLPAAGIFATTIVADTAATLANAAHCTATIGAYYGFDPNDEAERALIMSVVGAGLATGATKHAAMSQVRDVSIMLAQKKTWDVLNERYLVKLMNQIYGALSIKITKRSMAKGVPALGAVLGAGMNYRAVRRAVVTSGYLYRERFLLSKYGALQDAPEVRIEDIEIVHDRGLDERDKGLFGGDASVPAISSVEADAGA